RRTPCHDRPVDIAAGKRGAKPAGTRRTRWGAAGLAAMLVTLGAACSLVSSPPTPTPPPRPPQHTGIWQPAPGTTWQWQITGKVDTSVTPAAMYDVDLSDAVPSARAVPVAGFGT